MGSGTTMVVLPGSTTFGQDRMPVRPTLLHLTSIWRRNTLIESDNTNIGHTCIQTSREEWSPWPSKMRLLVCTDRSSRFVALTTRHQQQVDRLPVAQLPGPHRGAPQSQGCSATVLAVEQAQSGPICFIPEPLLVLSDRSPRWRRPPTPCP